MHARVHIASLAADEGFIHFNLCAPPAEFYKGLRLHRKANPLQHEPCAFLSDAEGAMHLVTTDSIFCVHQKPHGGKPLLQRDWRVLKNRTHLEGELLFWVVAVAAIHSRFFEIGHFLAAAIGTADDTVRPADFDHESAAILVISEVLDSFLECSRFVHNVRIVARHVAFVKNNRNYTQLSQGEGEDMAKSSNHSKIKLR